jgi:nucleoside-diphosphate-sugar epimerase
MATAPRRVLVTGGNGKVGVRVVQAFQAASKDNAWQVVRDGSRQRFLPRCQCHFPHKQRTDDAAQRVSLHQSVERTRADSFHMRSD